MEFVIDGIRKKYGKNQVLKEISLTLQTGKCVGVLGANGCGKSTLLNILSGIVKADGGTFTGDGQDLLTRGDLRSNTVGFVPQGIPLFRELTAKDNLRLWYSREQMERELSSGMLKMLGIDEFLNVRVSRMSGGMQKRLAIGCAIHNAPSLLLLDEPSAALDLVCKERVLDYLDQFRKQGGCVLIATHDIPEVAFCDEVYIMKDGKLIPFTYRGDVRELVEQL